MYVYNSLQYDGRVQRSADVLSEISALTVCSCNSNFETDKYNSVSINVKSLGIRGYFKFVSELIKYGKKNGPYDLLYAHDYYSAIPSVVMLLLGVSKKVIYDAHELYIPDNREDCNSKRERFFRWWESKLIKRANGIICANNMRGKIMKNYYRLEKDPLTIQNIAYFDKKVAEDNLPDEIKQILGKQGVTRIVYQGFVDISRQLDKIIRSFDQLGEDFELIIVGSGNDITSLKNMAGANVHFLGMVSREVLLLILTQCHIGILSYPTKGYNNQYCAPNKVFEYAYAHLPMVATENPTLRQIFEEYQIGYCSDNIVDAIKVVSSNLFRYRENLETFISQNSWQEEKEKLSKYIVEINGDLI